MALSCPLINRRKAPDAFAGASMPDVVYILAMLLNRGRISTGPCARTVESSGYLLTQDELRLTNALLHHGNQV